MDIVFDPQMLPQAAVKDLFALIQIGAPGESLGAQQLLPFKPGIAAENFIGALP